MVFNFKFQATENAKCSFNGFKHKLELVFNEGGQLTSNYYIFVYPCAKPLKVENQNLCHVKNHFLFY